MPNQATCENIFLMEQVAEVEVQDLAERLASDDYHILRIKNGNFPIEEFSRRVLNITQRYGLSQKDIYPDYKGIGLQYDDEENPLYDAVNSISLVQNDGTYKLFRRLNRSYLKRNEIGDQFEEFFDFFNETLYLVRGRILASEPGHRIIEHTDGKCSATLHYPVVTDPMAKLIVEGVEYHLPSDGSFYVLNASRPHYIHNKSSITRIHIIFQLTPMCFKKLTKSQFERMEPFFQQFKIDKSRTSHIQILDT